jgi:hypothetical protein
MSSNSERTKNGCSSTQAIATLRLTWEAKIDKATLVKQLVHRYLEARLPELAALSEGTMVKSIGQ